MQSLFLSRYMVCTALQQQYNQLQEHHAWWLSGSLSKRGEFKELFHLIIFLHTLRSRPIQVIWAASVFKLEDPLCNSSAPL